MKSRCSFLLLRPMSAASSRSPAEHVEAVGNSAHRQLQSRKASRKGYRSKGLTRVLEASESGGSARLWSSCVGKGCGGAGSSSRLSISSETSEDVPKCGAGRGLTASISGIHDGVMKGVWSQGWRAAGASDWRTRLKG